VDRSRANLDAVTAVKRSGFVADGPERAKSDQPPEFWKSIWWWIWGGYPDPWWQIWSTPGRTDDDMRKLWWRRS